MRAHWLLGIAALALAAGCSSSSGGTTPSDAGGDHDSGNAGGDAAEPMEAASPGPDATPDAPAEAATVCNMLANSAQAITYSQVNQDPPTPQGGTMADGTYALTNATIYTGPNGPSGPSGTSQTTIQITSGTIQIVESSQPPTRTVTIATSGTSFTATDTCPDATKVTHGSYTATPASILIFLDGGTDDAGARTLVETFTKQ